MLHTHTCETFRNAQAKEKPRQGEATAGAAPEYAYFSRGIRAKRSRRWRNSDSRCAEEIFLLAKATQISAAPWKWMARE